VAALLVVAAGCAAFVRAVIRLQEVRLPAIPPRAAAPRLTMPTVFRAEKLPAPDVRALMESAGSLPQRRDEMQELSDALDAYAAGNLAESARRLGAFADRYPANPSGQLYLGIAALLSGAPEDAVRPLRAARRLGDNDPSISSDAAWYLALAYEGSGERDQAMTTLQWLCLRDIARAQDACMALLEIARAPRPRDR
jgi:hypothetical protein